MCHTQINRSDQKRKKKSHTKNQMKCKKQLNWIALEAFTHFLINLMQMSDLAEKQS